MFSGYLNGYWDTPDHIRQDFPRLVQRTGFVTGDTMGRASQNFLREAKRPYIEKPVSPKELRDFVANTLTKAKHVTQ